MFTVGQGKAKDIVPCCGRSHLRCRMLDSEVTRKKHKTDGCDPASPGLRTKSFDSVPNYYICESLSGSPDPVTCSRLKLLMVASTCTLVPLRDSFKKKKKKRKQKMGVNGQSLRLLYPPASSSEA